MEWELILVVIVLIIVIISNNNDYKKQQKRLLKRIKELEEELKQYKQVNTEQIQHSIRAKAPEEKIDNKNVIENRLNNGIKNEEYIKNTKAMYTQKKENKQKNDEGIKNKFILMTGAILIVLAGIVFLTSTWHTIPNIVKTTTILLLAGVFVGASNIAKKVFKLEETANTFLYIALAYLPISLFSISLFGLIGDYLSIYGAGSNLYFAFSAGGLAVLYFTIGNRKKQNVLIHSSMIMQLLATIFISRCISLNINTIILGIIIYNILLLYLKKNYFKEYVNIINVYNDIYLYTAFIVEIIFLMNGNMAVDTLSNSLIFLSFYLKYKQDNDIINIITILTQIIIIAVSFLNTNANIFNIQTRELLLYILLVTMYLVGARNKKVAFRESLILVVSIAMVLLYFSTFMIESQVLIIKRYVIMWTIAIFNIINYNITNRKNLFINLIPISLFLAQINLVIESKITINYLIFMELAIFAFSVFNLLKDKESNIILQNYSNVMTLISIVIGLIIDSSNIISNTMIFIILAIVYCIGHINNKKVKAYKFITYFLLNIILYSFLYRFKLLQYQKYILFTTTTIITLIELYLSKVQDENSIAYVIFSYILSFIILNIYINITAFLLIILLDALFILYIKNRNVDKNLVAIPFIALLPCVYVSEWAKLSEINIMIFASFMLITISTFLSFKKEKINIYTIISAMYILMQMFSFNLNIYLNLTLALLWAILHLIKMPTEKTKFEVITYILGLIFYNNLLKDCAKINIKIGQITAFNYLGYIIFSILITRNILKKHFEDQYKIIEYLVFSLLYVLAITNYSSQIDGMIFVFMLVCIIVLSYIKKFGPIFFTSSVAVILNVFLLTREFWFSVPWWIYMLVIGSILILFAIKNELNENKNRELIKNKMKSFKEYIDM